jgi:hypothetical protein
LKSHLVEEQVSQNTADREATYDSLSVGRSPNPANLDTAGRRVGVARDPLDPALRARAEAARALLRNDPEVDRLSVLAAVVAPRDPLLSQVQPQGWEWRRTLNREAVEQLFALRDQGVSFGAIANDFRVAKGTLVTISQKAARDGREAVLERYKSAATNGDQIGDAKLASLHRE